MSWFKAIYDSLVDSEKSKPKQKEIRSIKQQVEAVRNHFQEDYEEDPTSYDKRDVLKVYNSDWMISRFVLLNEQGEVAALDMLKECLKWRHKNRITEFDFTLLPREFYIASPVFIHSKDLRGRNVLYFRAAVVSFNFDEAQSFTELAKKYALYMLNRVDSMSEKVGSWTLCVDATGASTDLIDLDLIYFLKDAADKYFPLSLRSILIHGATGVIKTLVSMATTDQSVTLTDENTIFNHIAREDLPDFMGGHSAVKYRKVPKVAKSVEEMDIPVDKETILKIKEYVEPFIVKEEDCYLVDAI